MGHDLDEVFSPISDGISSSDEDGFAFDAAFPPGWERLDRPGLRIARLRTDQYGLRDHILIMLRAEPLQGSIEQTFERIWNREMKQSDVIRLVSPGLLSPERPQPLRRRLNNGLAVWYEGGEGRLATNGASCYFQLFLIPAGDSVTAVIAIYGISALGTSAADRTPVMQFLESLKSSVPVPRSDLFRANDCVGRWEAMLIASLAGYYSRSTGAYLGDASSGASEDLSLNQDGTYVKNFAGKTPQMAWANDESGAWKVEDNVLILTPRRSPGTASPQVQKYIIYGRGTFRGELQLLLGSSDGARIPTDALESGATMEIAGRGGALFRFKAK